MPKAGDPQAAIRAYLAELQRNLASGIALENTHRPALEDLLESLDPTINAFNDPKHIDVGAPDFTIRRKGHEIDFPVGWVETKDIAEDLDKIEKSDQLARYLGLPSLILTDYLEFRWYTDGKRRLTSRLATVGARRKLVRDPEGEEATARLLTQFLSYAIQGVTSPRELAERMAGLAHTIRDITLNSYKAEPENGTLHRQLQAFRETLIPDLSPEQFADMYAQTIAYGLFAACCQKPGQRNQFTREGAAHLIPKTNPFLRKLFNEIAGPDLDERIRPFVDDLVALLRVADIGVIMQDFGKRTAKEDPVVHFYEDFLKEYDPKVREMRGVYYTPEPVVSYIVRSVDHLLKTRFSKPLGLADKDVLILDPACGTGTFLYFVIRHIYQTLVANGQKGQWNSYVSENLLKRIFGFELLMAPYAVAHLKLGLLLQELGYKFDSDERLGIFLTNTLEEAIKKSQEVFWFAEALAKEGEAAAEIKRDKKIMVVLGNPPYSGHSANRSWELKPDPKTKKLKKVPTFIGRLLRDYYQVDGKPLGEKNPKWLQDDYVKFIRFGQWRIERTGYGILAFITNHSYLDNPTFRGMRQQLRDAFPEISLLDLHGNTKKKETAPDGSVDSNVFDIQQGVAIGVFTKVENSVNTHEVRAFDLYGTRNAKNRALTELEFHKTPFEILPTSAPAYLFVPRESDLQKEYERGIKLTDLFPLNLLGFQTHRDGVAVAFDEGTLRAQIESYLGKPPTDGDWKSYCRPCCYRPFDNRYVFLHPEVTDRPRLEVTQHLFKPNLALNLVRQTKAIKWRHALISDKPTPAVYIEIKDGSSIFPLELHPDPRLSRHGQRVLEVDPEKTDHLNLNRAVLNRIERHLGLTFAYRTNHHPGSFNSTELLAYIYAILYSPSYQRRYEDSLKAEFPRVPFTSHPKLFASLSRIGDELMSVHLMKAPNLKQYKTRYEQRGDHFVEKVGYSIASDGKTPGRVFINRMQYFEGVTPEIWDFHIGGYQVCEKWLKDRKGRHLTSHDIDHYQKIVVAISETIRLMREIDDLIPGWPLP